MVDEVLVGRMIHTASRGDVARVFSPMYWTIASVQRRRLPRELELESGERLMMGYRIYFPTKAREVEVAADGVRSLGDLVLPDYDSTMLAVKKFDFEDGDAEDVYKFYQVYFPRGRHFEIDARVMRYG